MQGGETAGSSCKLPLKVGGGGCQAFRECHAERSRSMNSQRYILSPKNTALKSMAVSLLVFLRNYAVNQRLKNEFTNIALHSIREQIPIFSSADGVCICKKNAVIYAGINQRNFRNIKNPLGHIFNCMRLKNNTLNDTSI
ncbi:MAG: hypothetical protein CMI35_06090 [Owenweeksia sp.]|nr:hypothetical protein [Owenweeksia sp.]